MREILFRGRRTDNHQWVEGYLVMEGMKNPNPYIINRHGKYRVAHKTVGQYTGVRDGAGWKIFEGDTIETYTPFSKTYDAGEPFEMTVYSDIGTVTYADGGFRLQAGAAVVELSYLIDPARQQKCLLGEVVGNIHDYQHKVNT